MDSIFWQLYYAFVSHQGGVTNIRRIMAPMFDAETCDTETAQLYADADANPDEAAIVGAGFDNCGLYPPPRAATVEPESDPAPVETPPEAPAEPVAPPLPTVN